MGFYFDGSGQRTYRYERDDLDREDMEPLRPSPGKSSRTHGGGDIRGIPGKISLTARLAQRIDRYARAGHHATPDEHARAMVAQALGSTGQPLPDPVRRSLEEHADTSLADVHIHTGPESARAAEALGAEAFTAGWDIHFAAGSYDLCSGPGRRLLAHEVAHAIQQRSQPKVALEQAAISEPGQAHERHADEFAGLFERLGTKPREPEGDLSGATRTRMAHAFNPGEQHEKGVAPGACQQETPTTLDHCPAPVQKKSASQKNGEETSPLLQSSGGQPLPEEVRTKMEAAFRMDFSAVRIHIGPQAASLGALAFTRGLDIFFAPEQYVPSSQRGLELLGHELTHVVQQAEGRVGTSWDIGDLGVNDDPGLEREADEMGAQAARGEDVIAGPPVASKEPQQTHTVSDRDGAAWHSPMWKTESIANVAP